jgi:tetratricopeptide (TPR) repeat protein
MEILFARGELDAAIGLCEKGLESTRTAQQDADAVLFQAFYLSLRAQMARAEGRNDHAEALVAQIFALELSPGRMYPGLLVWLTLVYCDFGYGDRALALQVPGERVLPWHEAARMIAEGRMDEAADRVESLGDLALAAEIRLAAARAFARSARSHEAGEQLAKALAFHRSVGATRLVREGEALLPQVA